MANLTTKQQAFVEAYLSNGFNGTRAAESAGYNGDETTWAVIAYENLRKPQISEFVDKRIAEMAMSADEVLARLSEHARANVANFLLLSMSEIATHPRAHLLKKVKQTKRTTKDNETYETIEFEVHDPQAALVHLGRYHKLFVDRVQQDDWRSQAIADIRNGNITFEALADAFDNSLAAELFAEAGVPVQAR